MLYSNESSKNQKCRYSLTSCGCNLNFPGELVFLQIRRKDQHPPPSSPHRVQRSEHHRSDSRAVGGADPQPCSRAPGHRQSAPDRPNQVRSRELNLSEDNSILDLQTYTCRCFNLYVITVLIVAILHMSHNECCNVLNISFYQKNPTLDEKFCTLGVICVFFSVHQADICSQIPNQIHY